MVNRKEMNILKIAAFTVDGIGGNPAGVVFSGEMPPEREMLRTAAKIGYSETAFLHPFNKGWRIRYFSPEIEVPFCGHATIAAGASLGDRLGMGIYTLFLNTGAITVEVDKALNGRTTAALQSPETRSEDAPREVVESIFKLFQFDATDTDQRFPVRFAFAGAKHLVIVLKKRETLSEMSYHFEKTKALMLREDLTTISLLWPESDEVFHSRNAFASGGVYEDPATGAAAAALGGYLRDIGWRGKRRFQIIQGEDMGVPSRLMVEYTQGPGASVRVAGEIRYINEPDG
jgi:PhzF family phenazine biosynthesis protein